MVRQTTEYGRMKVESERGRSRRQYYVRPKGGDREAYCGTGKDGKKRARTLAATLDAAGQYDLDTLPPEWGQDNRLSKFGHENEIEEWACEENAVPAEIAVAGKPAVAGYLYVVYNESPSYMSLGVSESTIRQYLSDLREGRR
jgi:hypothetical protein